MSGHDGQPAPGSLSDGLAGVEGVVGITEIRRGHYGAARRHVLQHVHAGSEGPARTGQDGHERAARIEAVEGVSQFGGERAAYGVQLLRPVQRNHHNIAVFDRLVPDEFVIAHLILPLSNGESARGFNRIPPATNKSSITVYWYCARPSYIQSGNSALALADPGIVLAAWDRGGTL